MRIGMLPIYYATDQLLAISCVNGMIDLAKGILQNEKSSFVYFYVMGGFKYDEEDVKKRLGDVYDRFLIRVYSPYYKKFNWLRDGILFHQELYKMLSAKHGDCLDVLLNSALNAQFAMRSCLEDTGVRVSRDTPILVGWNNDVTHSIKEGQFVVSPIYEEQSCHAMAVSDYNQFFIPYELELACESAKKFLSFASVKKLRDTAIVEPMGIDFTEIGKVIPANHGKRDLKEFRFFYGGSFATKKRMDEMLLIVKELYRCGKPVKFMITSQMKEIPAGSKDLNDPDVKSFTEINFGCNRSKFIEKMADGDVFFAFTKNESMGLAYFEMLYSGMIGIFWDRPWLKGLLPINYPFKASSFEDAGKMAHWIVEHWNEARDMVNKCDVQAFLEYKFGYLSVSCRWYGRLKSRVDELTESRAFTNNWVCRIIKESADKWDDRFNMEYAYGQIKRYSEKGIDIKGRSDIATRGYFRRCLLASGRFADEYSGPEPTFVKIV